MAGPSPYSGPGSAAQSGVEAVEAVVNAPLRAALVAAAFVGVVMTPLIMAWWVRDLRRLATERSSNKKRRDTK
jgi:hypothetical protein